MRVLIDTNIFVYASYTSFSEHTAARDFLRKCATSSDSYAITWGIIYEYLRVVTHTSLFPHGTLSFDKAAGNVDQFRQLTTVEILQESSQHWEVLRSVVRDAGRARGNLLHDCHIVALMREHDVRRVYTADTDFRVFQGIEIVNPLKD